MRLVHSPTREPFTAAAVEFADRQLVHSVYDRMLFISNYLMILILVALFTMLLLLLPLCLSMSLMLLLLLWLHPSSSTSEEPVSPASHPH